MARSLGIIGMRYTVGGGGDTKEEGGLPIVVSSAMAGGGDRLFCLYLLEESPRTPVAFTGELWHQYNMSSDSVELL